MNKVEPGQEPEPELQADEPGDVGKFELKSQFVELRAKGFSFGRIAKKLRVSKTTVSEWNNELSEQVARLRAQELEAIQEKYALQKEARLKALGEHLRKMEKELAQRNLSDLPTDKLLELILKYHKQAQEERVEPVDTIRGPKVDDNGISLPSTVAQGLTEMYRLYSLGLLSDEQVKQGIGLTAVLLRANEQIVIEERLLSLEQAVEAKQ